MTLKEMERKREEILGSFLDLGDMRRGTLSERYVHCNKGGCHCSRSGEAGHGPNYHLTYKEKSKTKTETIQPAQVNRVREQLVNHQRFRELIHQVVELNEQICRARSLEPEGEVRSAVELKKKLQKQFRKRRSER